MYPVVFSASNETSVWNSAVAVHKSKICENAIHFVYLHCQRTLLIELLVVFPMACRNPAGRSFHSSPGVSPPNPQFSGQATHPRAFSKPNPATSSGTNGCRYSRHCDESCTASFFFSSPLKYSVQLELFGSTTLFSSLQMSTSGRLEPSWFPSRSWIRRETSYLLTTFWLSEPSYTTLKRPYDLVIS